MASLGWRTPELWQNKPEVYLALVQESRNSTGKCFRGGDRDKLNDLYKGALGSVWGQRNVFKNALAQKNVKINRNNEDFFFRKKILLVPFFPLLLLIVVIFFCLHIYKPGVLIYKSK